MDITLQYFDGCPNWKTTAEDLTRLIDQGLLARISFELIDSENAAVDRGFRGSPTVLIDGVDPFGNDNQTVGLACRIYRTEAGSAGSPSLRQLRQAITAVREGS